MLDEKMISESKKRVEQGLRDEKIIKEKEGKYFKFFLINAKNSLDVAQLLWDASAKSQLQKYLGFKEFNGYLWVIMEN